MQSEEPRETKPMLNVSAEIANSLPPNVIEMSGIALQGTDEHLEIFSTLSEYQLLTTIKTFPPRWGWF